MWAIFRANEGIYFTGIKAPHKNAEPSDITFTTPLIAPLLFTKFDIKIAIVKDTIKNNEMVKRVIERYYPLDWDYYSYTYIENYTENYGGKAQYPKEGYIEETEDCIIVRL